MQIKVPRPSLCLIAAAICLTIGGRANAQVELYGIDVGSPTLGRISMSDASTLSTVTLTLDGFTVNGGTGLAFDPTTGTLWAALKLSGQSGRQLATVNYATGVVTSVGDTGLSVAGITFGSDGTLYAITGDGQSTNAESNIYPESLYRLDKSTAAPSFLRQMGNGDDGEAIAFNPLDGFLYHASGHSGVFDIETGDGIVLEKLDLESMTLSDIPIPETSPLIDEEAQALVYYYGGNFFIWKQYHSSGPLFQVSPLTGEATLIGDTDTQWKGLAILEPFVVIPEPSVASLLGLGAGSLLLRHIVKRRASRKSRAA